MALATHRKNKASKELFAVVYGYHYCITSLTKPELRFCAGSNPDRGVSEIRGGEGL